MYAFQSAFNEDSQVQVQRCVQEGQRGKPPRISKSKRRLVCEKIEVYFRLRPKRRHTGAADMREKRAKRQERRRIIFEEYI